MERHQHDSNPIVLPTEDDPIHTEEHPFCSTDPGCPCHEDPARIHIVVVAVARGELTPEEATQFDSGKLV